MSEQKPEYVVAIHRPENAKEHVASKIFDRPIAFHRVFVDLTGSVMAALMLSQAMYWTGRGDDKTGWFWKTQSEWQDETGMNRYQQDKARAVLREHDFWQEELRGLPAKMHYRVNQDRLMGAVVSLSTVDKLDGSPSANSVVEGEQPITETTTETTTKDNTPSQDPMTRMPRQRNESLVATGFVQQAKDIGLNPKQYVDIVNQVIDECSLRVLIDNDPDSTATTRKYNSAKEAAIFLSKMGYAHPSDVHELGLECREWLSWRNDPTPSPDDLKEFVSKGKPGAEEKKEHVQVKGVGGEHAQ